MQKEREKEDTALLWWVFGGMAMTILFSALIYLRLPPSSASWTPLAMLAWSGILSLTMARSKRFFVAFAGMLWIALMFCAKPWGMELWPNSAMFTVLFPVTLPPALKHFLKPESPRETPTKQLSRMTLTLCAIGVFHFIVFFDRTTLATKLFLDFLVVMAFFAWRAARAGEVASS